MKIKVKQTVLKIVSESLNSEGFEYDKERSSSKDWVFSKKVGDITEIVSFQISDHYENSIRMRLTNSKDIIGIGVGGLLKVPKPWWPYHDQQSLEDILHEFMNAYYQNGREWFRINSISIPDLDLDISKKLVENSNEIAGAFCEKFDLNLNDPQSLIEVERILCQQKEKSKLGEFDLDLVVGAAAFLGEFICRRFGGEWELDPNDNTANLVRIGGTTNSLNSTFSSLSFVLSFWFRFPFEQGLESLFREFQTEFR